MNLQDRYAAGFIALGFVEIESPSTKYRCFHRPSGGSYFFVGKAGAVRRNGLKRIGGSIPVRNSIKEGILRGPQNTALAA